MERNPLSKSRHCAPDVIHFIGFAAACEGELTYFPSCRLIFWLLSLLSPRGTTVLTAVLIVSGLHTSDSVLVAHFGPWDPTEPPWRRQVLFLLSPVGFCF